MSEVKSTTPENKFSLLRRVLRTVGLSQQSADEVVNFIVDILAGQDTNNTGKAAADFPYRLSDHFLTAAEFSFYSVLQLAVDKHASVCPKVNLRDVFFVTKNNPSDFRIYTNKIDRKHIDFLLCDPTTMRPLVGIELDDKSHQRQERQERDAFVNQVFQAARLPLVHVPVRQSYRVEDIRTLIAPHLKVAPKITLIAIPEPKIQANVAPICPKCGSEMILRTAKKGDNAGQQFWGCSKYPTCKTMLPHNS